MKVKGKVWIWVLTGLFQTSYVVDIRVGLGDNTFGFHITPSSLFMFCFFSFYFHLGLLHMIPQSLVLSEGGKKIGTLRPYSVGITNRSFSNKPVLLLPVN